MKRWTCLLLGLYACMWCVRAQDKEKIKEAMTHYAYEEVIPATSKVDLLDEDVLSGVYRHIRLCINGET